MPVGVLRPVAVPAGYFGMHVHDPVSAWPTFGFSRLRLWDTRTNWFHLQPAQQRWVFDRLDAIVQACEKRSVAVLMPLGMTPRWASARPDEPSPYGVPGAAAEPAELGHWQRYVQTVGERYRGRIRHYELWNEVNAGAGFYTGTPEVLFELQRVAYQTLKAIDPGITFIAPSSEGESENKFVWFERYLSLMQGRYADVVSYHFYTPRKGPEAMLPVADRVRRIMARTGCAHLPLWNTESGYRVNWGQAAAPGGTMGTWPSLAPELAAAWLVRAYILGWIAGLDAYFWYAFDNRVMGMVGPSKEPGVISASMIRVVAWLTGSVAESVVMEQGGPIRVLLSRSGRRRWMVWMPNDRPLSWQAPRGAGLRHACALDGEPVALGGGDTVLLDAMPVVMATDQRDLALA